LRSQGDDKHLMGSYISNAEQSQRPKITALKNTEPYLTAPRFTVPAGS